MFTFSQMLSKNCNIPSMRKKGYLINQTLIAVGSLSHLKETFIEYFTNVSLSLKFEEVFKLMKLQK